MKNNNRKRHRDTSQNGITLQKDSLNDSAVKGFGPPDNGMLAGVLTYRGYDMGFAAIPASSEPCKLNPKRRPDVRTAPPQPLHAKRARHLPFWVSEPMDFASSAQQETRRAGLTRAWAGGLGFRVKGLSELYLWIERE